MTGYINYTFFLSSSSFLLLLIFSLYIHKYLETVKFSPQSTCAMRTISDDCIKFHFGILTRLLYLTKTKLKTRNWLVNTFQLKESTCKINENVFKRYTNWLSLSLDSWKKVECPRWVAGGKLLPPVEKCLGISFMNEGRRIGVVMIWRLYRYVVEKRAENDREAVNLLVDLRSYSHL